MKPQVSWDGVRGRPSGYPVEAILSDGIVDRASNSGAPRRFWMDLARLCPPFEHGGAEHPEEAARWLEDEIGPFIEFWKTKDRHIRRAWLCLARLGLARE